METQTVTGEQVDTSTSNAAAASASSAVPGRGELPEWLKVVGKTPTVRALLLANTVMFAAMTGCSGIKSLFIPSSQVLLHFGASSGASTIIDGEYWRIATSAFVHVGLLHLMMNSYVLWDIGPLVEKLFGSKRFVIIYMVSALGGALSSLMFNPFTVSAGASGAIFGLFGALLAFFWCHRRDFPHGFLKLHAKIVAIFVLYGIGWGALIQGTDNASHIGGLFFGFGAALSLMPWRPGSLNFERRDIVATMGAAMYCVALFALDLRVVSANREVSGDAAYRQAVELLQRHEPKEALPLLNTAAALMPQITSVRWDRARALMATGDNVKALRDCDEALKQEPNSKVALMIRSSIFHAMSDEKRCIDDLTSVIKLDPNLAMAYNNRAWSYNAIGNYNAAVDDVNQAIKLNRTCSTFYDTRAVSNLLLRKPEDAISDLAKATMLKRADGAFSYHLACAYKQLGKTDLMEQNIKRAKELGYAPEKWEPRLD